MNDSSRNSTFGVAVYGDGRTEDVENVRGDKKDYLKNRRGPEALDSPSGHGFVVSITKTRQKNPVDSPGLR